jgi:molybdopterin-synthase adenylyltransferase
MQTDQDRYSRQARFTHIGELGQQRISASKVLICGCGALGSMIAERLARAGVGTLRLVDRDWVELSNLQRQALYTEEDASLSRPKAIAAADALGKINSEVQLVPIVEDVVFQNIASLADGCDLVLDGTDNFETRFLINDYCVKNAVPWIHGGCLGASGQVMSILPGETACFRCLMPELPPRDVLETCDSAGVLGSAVGLVACWQVAEAIKILSGNKQAICRGLIVLDSWHSENRIVAMQKQPNCGACAQAEFPYLTGKIRSEVSILCGKNAVQIQCPAGSLENLVSVAEKLSALGKVVQNSFFVRLSLPSHQVTLFRGGRAVVEGTTDSSEAKNLLARTLGY